MLIFFSSQTNYAALGCHGSWFPWLPLGMGWGTREDEGREGGAQKRQEPIAKILNKADDVGRLFFPRKKNKKAEWVSVGKDGGCVLHPLMF